MRVCLLFSVAIALAASPVSAQQNAQKGGKLTTLREKASYSFGMTMGATLKKQGVEIEVPLLVQGIRDATEGKTLLTDQEAVEAMQAFEKAMIAKQAEDSKKFLAENKGRPGVITTKTGLQYKVLKPGNGPKPKPDDVVRVNYRASFVNGEEFERNGNAPFTTPVNQVIPGWQEALLLMPVGSKWQLFVPPDLGYGEQGSPPIGPNTTLVFELELLEIAKPAAGASRKPAPRPVK
jgi:FKBP-type peptidyl-prolyl cis-trans isomerase